MSRPKEEEEGCFGLIVAVFIILSLFRGSCNDEVSAVRVARATGYSQVKVTDHSWFLTGLRGCEASDASRFRIDAVNAAGEPTKVEICMGWPFKNGTVRVNWWDDAELPMENESPSK